MLPVLFILVFASLLPSRADEYHWYKGDTHTHTNRVDGDAAPEEVAKWYKAHGYNFLVLSDHDCLTDPSALDGLADSSFILIPGEEISGKYDDKSLHVNGINIKRKIDRSEGNSVTEVLQKSVDAVRAQGGVPQINHPNRFYSINDRDLLALKNVNLLEIYNMNKDSNNFGGGRYLSTEQIWDRVLTAGKVFYGVCSDDSHFVKREFDAAIPYAGKAWVVVKAPTLTAGEIAKALEKGDFYSSNGVILEDVKADDREYVVKIVEPKGKDYTFTTKFIGRGGKVLATVDGLCARYKYRGDELYIRARVRASSGDFAITQPHFLSRKK